MADQQKMRMTCVTTRMPLDSILARIKDRLWEFLTETEHELTFGEATAETFDRLRSYVDRQLTTISARPLSSSRPHTVGSRTVAMKTGRMRLPRAGACSRHWRTSSTRPVGACDGFRWQVPRAQQRRVRQPALAIRQRDGGQARERAVVQATLKDVDARLSALNELASKGVHADATTYEVETARPDLPLVAELLRFVSAQPLPRTRDDQHTRGLTELSRVRAQPLRHRAPGVQVEGT